MALPKTSMFSYMSPKGIDLNSANLTSFYVGGSQFKVIKSIFLKNHLYEERSFSKNHLNGGNYRTTRKTEPL